MQLFEARNSPNQEAGSLLVIHIKPDMRQAQKLFSATSQGFLLHYILA